MKNNRKEIILTTLVCLLPILAGLALYNRLPENIAVHFGPGGEPDGWASRTFAVLALPIFHAMLNLLCHFSMARDPKKQNMAPPLRTLTAWLMPALSVLLYSLILSRALGYAIRIEIVMPALMGVLLILIGNYLPKTKQSHTLGIRLPWTLSSEENWNRTHRLAGFLWVLGGFALVVLSLLGMSVSAVLFVLLPLVLIPLVYSFSLHTRGI